MTDLDDDMSGEVDKEEFMKAVRRGAFDALFHPADNRLLADDEHDHGPTEIEHGQGKLKVRLLLFELLVFLVAVAEYSILFLLFFFFSFFFLSLFFPFQNKNK